MAENSGVNESRGNQLDAAEGDLMVRIGGINLDLVNPQIKTKFYQSWEIFLKAEPQGILAYLLLRVVILEHRLDKITRIGP